MNTQASFQPPDAFKRFLGEPWAAQAVQRHWLHGCAQVQQSWMRSTRDLFGHCDALLREGQSLQDSVLTHYFDWVRDWTGGAAADRSSSTEKPVPQAGVQPASPAQEVLVEDDLTRIRGVGRVVQHRLNCVGVVSFDQIATWTDMEIAYIENNVLGSAYAGCIKREHWQEQAKELLEDT